MYSPDFFDILRNYYVSVIFNGTYETALERTELWRGSCHLQREMEAFIS